MSETALKEKFSYSKLSTYESCGWQYKLKYVDKHFINQSAIATDFGTLVHYIEETIARDIIANNNEPIFMIDENKYIDLFINADIHTADENVIGMKKIHEKYPNEFFVKDKNGLDYEDKGNIYLETGIHRLQNYLAANRNLRLIGIEQPFDLEYRDYVFHGFIDRVFQDINTGKIIIEDIKTYSTPLEDKDLKTPLQFVFYTMAAQQLYNVTQDQISCAYEIILCDTKQSAGSNGYLNRGIKKIDKLLDAIESKDFTPKPSALCHWCIFSKTYKDGQPDEAKGLCPYFSHWTRENKDFSVEYEWMGMENHEQIMEAFRNSESKTTSMLLKDKIILENLKNTKNDRIMLFRT